jgi:hypothetical protein
MPVKRATSAATAQANIKRTVQRGPHKTTTITSEDKLTEFERQIKREIACHYKAADYKYKDIAAVLGITVDVVKKWFQEQEMQDATAKIVDNMLESTIKYGRLQTFEMLDIIADIARKAEDDKVALQAAAEYLDRVGLTKVNKSESLSTATTREEREVRLVDKEGLIEALSESAPPEVLQRAATLMDELFSLTAEHTDKDVTHA